MNKLWQSEFGPDYEVPAKLDALVEEGTLVELSWHNDVAPSYALNNGLDGEDYRLWADHPKPEMRETGFETTRFYVCGYEKAGDDCAETIYEGDDLDKAIATLLSKRNPEVVTLSRGGTDQRTVKIAELQIPDIYKIAGIIEDKELREQVRKVWHIAHDLKRELIERLPSK